MTIFQIPNRRVSVEARDDHIVAIMDGQEFTAQIDYPTDGGPRVFFWRGGIGNCWVGANEGTRRVASHGTSLSTVLNELHAGGGAN